MRHWLRLRLWRSEECVETIQRTQGEGQRPGTQLGSESVSAGTRDQDNPHTDIGPVIRESLVTIIGR